MVPDGTVDPNDLRGIDTYGSEESQTGMFHPIVKALPDELEFNGVKIPKRLIIDRNYCTPKVILEQPNAEVRRLLIDLYPGQLIGFLKDGGGTTVMKPKNKHDYQFGEIIEFTIDNEKSYYLLVTNRTIEPDSEKLTELQRQQKGLTKEGFKKYLLECKDPKSYNSILDAVGQTWPAFKVGEYYPDVEA
jgi:hypothetical protein